MQISSAALLAAQGQASTRPRNATPAFEPMAFAKVAPASVVDKPVLTDSATASPSPASGFVRLGTNLDIKI